jgi:hypothetical protein
VNFRQVVGADPAVHAARRDEILVHRKTA